MIKKRIKKIFLFLLVILFCIPMFGCWDYVTLPDTAVVLGIAIDKDPQSNMYKVSLDIIDSKNSSKDKGIKDMIVECEGETIFDAIRNAKERLANKPFFGNMEVVVISEDIAKNDGITYVLYAMLRDREPRETVDILISQEKTAQELLSLQGLTDMSALELHEIVHESAQVNSKTPDMEIFEVFNMLEEKKQQITLPVFHKVKNMDKETFESNGCAIFKGDKLIGYLDPVDTFYYLMVDDKIKGGEMVLKLVDDVPSCLEVLKSKTKMSYTYDEKTDKFTFNINIQTVTITHCLPENKEYFDEDDITKMQNNAQMQISDKIKNVVSILQNQYDSDIFGFGELVYRKDPKLWDKVQKDWDTYFKTCDVQVNPKIDITSTGIVRK